MVSRGRARRNQGRTKFRPEKESQWSEEDEQRAWIRGWGTMAGAGSADGAAFNTSNRTEKQHEPKIDVVGVERDLVEPRGGKEDRSIATRGNDGQCERAVV